MSQKWKQPVTCTCIRAKNFSIILRDPFCRQLAEHARFVSCTCIRPRSPQWVLDPCCEALPLHSQHLQGRSVS